jgi:hypothetical protein
MAYKAVTAGFISAVDRAAIISLRQQHIIRTVYILFYDRRYRDGGNRNI